MITTMSRRSRSVAILIGAMVALSVAGCTKPDPSRLPALTADQLATSAIFEPDVADATDDERWVAAGSATSPSTNHRDLSFARQSAARSSFEQLAVDLAKDVAWERISCDGPDVFLAGGEEIGGYRAAVELVLSGAEREVAATVESPRAGDLGSGGSSGALTDLSPGSCDQAFITALRAAS